ncbi:tautomerase family protein [Paracidovorax anthurii]|uniref:Tautomerase-like protein n=1 Tax=Paracidovorax anthurii TaxID=78229 RepID=A0A328YW68_9BURK|nr:tautomerase family protein [Paracidovorax anthurii]RAR77393.1 tautomerase-like protein [Paracidovorax anthurii]WCM92937.1 tautomerase family protein [Acidovorax sp. NCPPB 2350]
MPFIHTYLPQATPPGEREGIVQAIHQALVDGIAMPEDELFNMVTAYAPGQFAFSRSFNGVARSDEVVVVEITLRRGRSDAMKRDLYTGIARNLGVMARVAPADVFIFMHENDYSDWSVGYGRFAMGLVQQVGAPG